MSVFLLPVFFFHPFPHTCKVNGGYFINIMGNNMVPGMNIHGHYLQQFYAASTGPHHLGNLSTVAPVIIS